jgi:hypothetical protein
MSGKQRTVIDSMQKSVTGSSPPKAPEVVSVSKNTLLKQKTKEDMKKKLSIARADIGRLDAWVESLPIVKNEHDPPPGTQASILTYGVSDLYARGNNSDSQGSSHGSSSREAAKRAREGIFNTSLSPGSKKGKMRVEVVVDSRGFEVTLSGSSK